MLENPASIDPGETREPAPAPLRRRIDVIRDEVESKIGARTSPT